MTPLILFGLLATSAITALAVAAGMLITGQLLRRGGAEPPPRVEDAYVPPPQSIAARIEIADLRARIKRLEAIADGVDF